MIFLHTCNEVPHYKNAIVHRNTCTSNIHVFGQDTCNEVPHCKYVDNILSKLLSEQSSLFLKMIILCWSSILLQMISGRSSPTSLSIWRVVRNEDVKIKCSMLFASSDELLKCFTKCPLRTVDSEFRESNCLTTLWSIDINVPS